MICGLIGAKLGYSYSPIIHEQLNKLSGREYSYSLFELSRDELQDFILHGSWDGLNVTIPYKQEVMKYCSELSDIASRIGSVNTLVKDENGRVYGDNTDYYGFCRMVSVSGINVSGTKALVLGSGGASRMAVTALRDMDAGEVVVISRTGENNYSNLNRHYDADIIVNTTPVGTYPDVDAAPVELGSFKQLKGVLDIIYNPSRTALILQAEKLGITCMGGLHMLVAQAEISGEVFCENMSKISSKVLIDTAAESNYSDLESITSNMRRDISFLNVNELDFGHVKDKNTISNILQVENIIRSSMENIVLIGMPGSGKSTIAKMLGHRLRRQVVETDVLIEERLGKSIPEIFSEAGETGFRLLEQQVIHEVGKESGLIISTGGGCVTVDANYDSLHRNGKIILINRDISKLAVEGRPLSEKKGLEELYNARRDAYHRFADIKVDNNGTVEAAVDEIINLFSF